ncbi:MAG TPA: hydrogenase maturation protease [Vicinamibacterales bacterium]|jgi:hydrogenase maturation protease
MGRLLVAGIGNIFLGDDGFGVEVARRLTAESPPEGVDVADFGIRGLHLAYELADGRYDTAILVDAAARGGVPGTVYVIEADAADAATDAAAAGNGHGLTPDAVLAWLKRLGTPSPRVLVVGCEPATVEEGIGLSEPVAAAVDEAVAVLHRLMVEHTCV